MAVTATVSSKGQIVIPAKLRKRYGLTTGTTVVFQEEKGRLVIEPTDPFEKLLALRGSLRGYDLEGELIRMRAEERRREDKKLKGYR